MPKIRDVYFKAIEEGKEHCVTSQDIRLLISRDMGYGTHRYFIPSKR